MDALLLGAFGAFVGAYGALVGVGGGFLIVPALLLFLRVSPQQAIGSSLLVVFFNAASATLSYVRARRIDYRSGWRFSLATLPGAVLGAYASRCFSVEVFAPLFGGLLILLSILLLRRFPRRAALPEGGSSMPKGSAVRTMTDASGREFTYSFNEGKGVTISVFVGFLSSILGIGGGIVHVPALIQVLSFPPHIATATSTFILLFSSMVGAVTHCALGHIVSGPVVPITVGVVVGAQVGAGLSGRVSEVWLLRWLSLALVAGGVRLIWH